MTQTQTAPAKPAEASPAKPLFGFRALLADLAGWIRRHLLTVCLVLFVILINVGTQIVCALIRQPFPPSLAKVSFEALARGRWYTAPISMLYVPNLGRLLIDVPLMLVAFGLAESVIGKIKTAWVSVITTLECIILSVNDTYMDAQEVMHMTDYSKITALYSRLSVGDEDRDGGESNSIQNQKIFLENYAKGQHLTNIRHYIDDDESGRFFDRSAYSRMMDDVENGKIGVCIMKDLTRWGRDYLQVGNAMEIFRRNNVRFIAVNNGIDSEKPDTLEFAPFINIMSEWYAKDISKKVKTGIKTKGMSGKPIVTEAPYGYVKDPNNKDFWIIDEEAAAVVRLIFRLFIGGKNRNQIAVHLKNEQIPTPTFYMKDRGRGTCKNKTLNEDNRCKWNKATLTNILTRQEYCGDVVNFKTTKHFRDKHNHYVDRSQWHITENVHEPIISRSDFETVQRILENASVRRPNGDGEIHPLSGLLFCKDCGAKMHIRIDYRNGGKRHVAYCSEYHKGKAKNPKCHSPHIMDADLLMQTIAEVLKKIEDYSISNRAEFEVLVKKNLAMQQTDQSKKQQKRIPQITTRLEQIDKVLNKLYEDNALGTIPQDRYEQMSQKYSEEYYALKAELATLQEQLSAYENAGGRAQKFLKLTERHAAFTDLTPAILNEFISRIEVHERDQKRARYAIQHISIYFNYIGKFENEVTQLAEPTEQEIRQMRAQIGKLKEWIADLFKARETAPEQPPQSPNLANLLMKYLSVQREKSRKYSQRWQQQHTADELKTIAAAVNYLSEHGISNLDELDASLSSVSDRAYSIREGMKTAEQRMKELQKLMEYGRNYQTYKPIQDEYRQIRWKGKQEKFAEARRAELTLWNAANRYLHANLPKGTKTLPIAEWEQEYADLKTQRDSDYTKLKDTRAEVAELQKIRKCVDIALRADQPEQTQNRAKRHEQER